MPLSYLCPNHRHRLLKDPGAADETWRRAYSDCLTVPESSRHRQRINLAGCAYETAHILMTVHGDESRRIRVQEYSP